MSRPVVSVVIPTRNRLATLRTALASILAQTCSRWEAIVVDDGSDPPVPAQWEDSRIRVVRIQHSAGVAAARNRGFDAAQGELICLLDDDDVYLPDKFRLQVSFLNEHPEIDLVFSKLRVVYPDGRFEYCLPDNYVHDAEQNLASFNAIHTNSALWRRAVSERVRFDERLTRFTDTQFFIAAAFAFRAHYLSVEVACWNRGGRPDQITRSGLLACHTNLKLLLQIFQQELVARPSIHSRYLARLDEIETEILRRKLIGG